MSRSIGYIQGPWFVVGGQEIAAMSSKTNGVWVRIGRAYGSIHGFRLQGAAKTARLMAAAPDMLEALENLENDDGSIPDHAWEMVQEAIKKAKYSR